MYMYEISCFGGWGMGWFSALGRVGVCWDWISTRSHYRLRFNSLRRRGPMPVPVFFCVCTLGNRNAREIDASIWP